MADERYKSVVGLEVHVQLLTATKPLCGCGTRFGLPLNSATCPVCLELRGSLPVMNCRAFELALRAALALNRQIAPFTKWHRKNYYYPDLPKNYQFSQCALPMTHDSWREINVAAGPKNALERLAKGYDSECSRVRPDLEIAQGQLRDYQARLGAPFPQRYSRS